MTRIAVISAVAVAALFFADNALAQGVGNFLGASDVYGMAGNMVHGALRLGQYGLAAAGMWAGWKAYEAHHNFWEASMRVGTGALLFFGVPMATGLPVF